MKIAMTGASGFIGSLIASHLSQRGHEIFKLSRQEGAPFYWNPEIQQISEETLALFREVEVFIHLSGEDISKKRWTSDQKKIIRESRVQGTQFLTEQLLKESPQLHTFIQASAVGYYGNRPDEELTEESSPGLGFLANLATEWEHASMPLEKKGVRRVLLRFGMVLDSRRGALAEMLTPFKWGLGGVLGSGKQWISWIAGEDVQEIVAFALDEKALEGAVNVVAPEPVTNRQFTKALGKALSRPTFLRLPKSLVKLLFGEMADEVLLSSTQVKPQKLMHLHYPFRHPNLLGALQKITSKR
ncbi:MAG: hypothetical protein K0S07_1196 [Chlamydiales bacterium]|jgi:uncharacterized protein (TIGR01777 family)|nr:hypothetical protein [Chlamydiales bacterium]